MRLIVIEQNLPGSNNIFSRLIYLDGHFLHIYQSHKVLMQVQNTNETKKTTQQVFLLVDVIGIDLILGMKQLEWAAFIVYFDTKCFSYKKVLILSGELLLHMQLSKRSIHVGSMSL